MSEETIELIPPETVAPWTDNPDEQRRAFVITWFAELDRDPRKLVEAFDIICAWIKDGTLPRKPKLVSRGDGGGT